MAKTPRVTTAEHFMFWIVNNCSIQNSSKDVSNQYMGGHKLDIVGARIATEVTIALGRSMSGWQVRTDQGFCLLPHVWVAFDLRVGFHEDAVVPGIFVAGVRAGFVVESNVAEDLGACVGSAARMAVWPWTKPLSS